MVRWRGAGLCLAALCAAAFLASCNSSASGDGERGERQPSPSPTSQRNEWSQGEQAALETYERFIEVVDEAFTDPLDPVASQLDRYATPELAQEIRQRVAGYEALGRARRPETFFEADTVTIKGPQATIVGCLSDFGVVYEVASGAVIDDARVQEIATTVVTRGADGTWRIAATDDGRGDVPCRA